jgi:hypothetical protein
MHRKIIIEAFNKAHDELQKDLGVVASTRKKAKFLSSKIYEINGFSFGERSLRDLQKLSKKEKGEVEIKQPQVVHALCKYLGFENYEDYITKYHSKEDRRKTDDGGVIIISPENSNAQTLSITETTSGRFSKSLIIKISIVITIITSIVVGVVIFNEQKWMEWKEDHYEKVSFDQNGVQEGRLKLYKEDRINNFKRIDADCNTAFFTLEGTVKVWYGKNKKGELEYFTDLGLHPITGKTLKPITEYMIKKHICPTYND